MHPELIRLNFLDYLTAIRALGHKLVFPDLFSPTSKSLLGDRMYDEFQPILAEVCAEQKIDAKLVIHSSRHGFNDSLKQRRVHEEERADLLGHGGRSETSERYCNPVDIVLALELLKKIPIVTEHLRPRPIQLLPWIEAHEVAPFSRKRRIDI